MILKNALRQLLRTPVRTVLFSLLILLCCLFMCSGISLYMNSSRGIAAAEGSFRTIGTIEQKSDAVGILDFWAPFDMQWVKIEYPTYAHTVDVKRLADLPCIQPPEKREFYLAYVPQLNPAIHGYPNTKHPENRNILRLVVEFTPRETFNATEPHGVDVTHFYYGNFDSDAYNFPPPEKLLIRSQAPDLMTGERTLLLEKGKRYVASGMLTPTTTEQYEQYGYHNLFLVSDGIGGQVYPNMMAYTGPTPAIMEVTEGFEDTPEWRAFQAEIDWRTRMDSTIPLQPTQDHHLLLPFFNRTARVTAGREITPEEYRDQAMVCMIPADMAGFAGIQPGDYIDLSLYEVDRMEPASQVFPPAGKGFNHFCALTQDGNLPDFFDTPRYQVVGLYSYQEKTDFPSGYELADNLVIVPSGTVQGLERALVPLDGPMLGTTTSFEIENGTSERFLAALRDLGLEELEVRFYDGGYETVMKGLRSTRRTALILIAVSTVCCLGVLLLFVFLQAGRKRAEIGIERSLGLTKGQSMLSLLGATLPVSLGGSLLGCAAGSALSGRLQNLIQAMAGQELFDPYFSAQVNAADRAAHFALEGAELLLPNAVVTLAILLVTLLLTLLFGAGILRLPPMRLLSAKE